MFPDGLKGLMLAHAAGTDEFEGFKYVLKADGHWRSAAEVHPRRGRSKNCRYDMIAAEGRHALNQPSQ